MTDRLRQKAKIFIQKTKENELGENEPYMEFLREIYCEIVPLNSTIRDLPANAEYNEHKYRIKARYNSVKDIEKSWEIEHNNEKYKVVYFNLDYKNREFIEIFCIRIEE